MVVVVVVVSGAPKVFMAPGASNHNRHPLTEITNVIKKHNHLVSFFLFPSIPLNLLEGGANFLRLKYSFAERNGRIMHSPITPLIQLVVI